MSRQALAAFIFGFFFFISVNAFAADTAKTEPSGSLKIKEFVKDFDVKISRKDLLSVIDTLSQTGKISKADAEKAKKEISAMSDEQFSSATKKAIDQIPSDMTLDDAKDQDKVMEKLKKKP